MKVYIAGKITGLPIGEARRRFDEAEELLSRIGCDAVNPMKKDLPDDASWNEHMKQDFALLLDCDAIYLMDNWEDSRGARIERFTASETGMDVLLEREIRSCDVGVLRIRHAIREVTGLRFEDYTTPSRKRGLFYARMIFGHHCMEIGMSKSEIARRLNRKHSSVVYFLRRYEDDVICTPAFRRIALEVEQILGETEK